MAIVSPQTTVDIQHACSCGHVVKANAIVGIMPGGTWQADDWCAATLRAQSAAAWNRPDTAAGAGPRKHIVAKRETHSKIVRRIIATVVRAAGRWIPHSMY